MNEKPAAGALAVVGAQTSPILQPLRSVEVQAMLASNLEGSKLTPQRLLEDLAGYLTANPKIAAAAKGPGLFNCVQAASRYQTSFGDGGLWIIPDGKVDDVRPQESEKFITDRAKEDAGGDIRAVMAFKPDEPVKVERGNIGQIEKFTLNDADFGTARNMGNLIGGFGVCVFDDPAKSPRIEWFDLDDLNRRKNHSAAAKQGKAPAWNDDPLAMYARSIRAAMGRLVNPIRVRVPGMTGDMRAPLILEGDFEELPNQIPFTSPTDSTAAELAAEAQNANPSADQAETGADTGADPTESQEPPADQAGAPVSSTEPPVIPDHMDKAKQADLIFDTANEAGKSMQETWDKAVRKLYDGAAREEQKVIGALCQWWKAREAAKEAG